MIGQSVELAVAASVDLVVLAGFDGSSETDFSPPDPASLVPASPFAGTSLEPSVAAREELFEAEACRSFLAQPEPL
jgi:hypothetical protein